MSRSYNKIVIVGNVGSDPEVRTTSGGTKVAKLSVATGMKRKDRNGQMQERTDWHRVTCWDKLAEIVEQYVRKGDRLLIEGRVEYTTTEDDAGNKRYYTDIIASELLMLGAKDGERSERPQQQQRGKAPAGPSPFDADDDDLPF